MCFKADQIFNALLTVLSVQRAREHCERRSPFNFWSPLMCIIGRFMVYRPSSLTQKLEQNGWFSALRYPSRPSVLSTYAHLWSSFDFFFLVGSPKYLNWTAIKWKLWRSRFSSKSQTSLEIAKNQGYMEIKLISNSTIQVEESGRCIGSDGEWREEEFHWQRGSHWSLRIRLRRPTCWTGKV